MKQAILLLLHRDFHQAKRLIKYFDGQCNIFIHIDKGGNISKSEEKQLERLPGVIAVYRKIHVHWAGYSILQAEIFLLRKALELSDCSYFHLLSGQDYPLRPLNDFLSFFSHTQCKGYVNCKRLPCDTTDNGTYYRIQHFVLSDYINTKDAVGKRKVWKFVEWQKRHGIKRRIPDYFDYLYGGSAWFSISRELAQYLIGYTKKQPDFYRRMRFTYIPEEIYVPTVLLNSPYRNNIIGNNNCRTVIWRNEGVDCSPIDITKDIFYRLFTNPIGFFSRKFSPAASNEVMDMIDKYLLKTNEFEVMENGAWTTVGLSYYHFDIGLCESIIKVARSMGLRRICDFGCGPGWYVTNFRKRGLLAVGYDANPNTRLLSGIMTDDTADNSTCGNVDLTEDVIAREPFDLVLCLSVGQYIKPCNENKFIGNLKRNSSKYIVICWGDEDLSGYGIVNNRGIDYIIDAFCANKEFVLNEFATQFVRNHSLLYLHQKSLLVFQKV